MSASEARRRHRKHANPFTIRGDIAVPDFTAVYGHERPFALDIGFGEGMFLVELAARHPEWNVLGFEIRQHLIDGALAMAKDRGIKNVHAMLANANVHLDVLVPDSSVAFAAVNFPDPWYKKRHQKRRVVTPELLQVLSRKLTSGGELHAMSDYEPIAREILALLEEAPGFVNIDGKGKLAAESTTGIATEREEKHLGRGEPIYRMRFRYKR